METWQSRGRCVTTTLMRERDSAQLLCGCIAAGLALQGKMELYFLERAPQIRTDASEQQPGRYARSSGLTLEMTYSQKVTFL